MAGTSAIEGVDQRETHAGDAVRERGDVFLASHEAQHLTRIAFELAHYSPLLQCLVGEACGTGQVPDI